MADARDLLKRFNEEVFGDGRVELIDELVHPDFVDRTGFQGPMDREGLKAFVNTVHAALSDVEATLERTVVDGDQVAWRWRMSGRFTGEFMGIAPNGQRIEITGNDLGVLRDGKLAESWGEMDILSLMSQFGAIDNPFG